MQSRLLVCLGLAGACFVTRPASAQSLIYRGPAAVVPPATMEEWDGRLGADLTSWDYWWAFNKDRYLPPGTQPAGPGQLPSVTPDEIDEQILPALIAALRGAPPARQATLLMALGKSGAALGEASADGIAAQVRSFLRSSDQQVVETAVLALGVLGSSESVTILIELSSGESMSLRTRIFAAQALGLIGSQTHSNEVRQVIAEHLVVLLQEEPDKWHQLHVMAMTAFGMTPVDWNPQPSQASHEAQAPAEHAQSRETQLRFLWSYFTRTTGRREIPYHHRRPRSHAPRAMAHLLRASEAIPSRSKLRTSVVSALLTAIGKHSKDGHEVKQSCVLALGQIGTAGPSPLEASIRKDLMLTLRNGGTQARRFALIALAQSGSRPGPGDEPWAGTPAVRKFLTERMNRGKSRIKPWAALALGVMGQALLKNGQELDPDATKALRRRTLEQKSPTQIGPYIVACGLRRDRGAQQLIHDKFEYLSMIDTSSSIYSPPLSRAELQSHAAIALMLMGPANSAGKLYAEVRDTGDYADFLLFTGAIGEIGEMPTLRNLIGILANEQAGPSARTSAAAALGICAQGTRMPWNLQISSNLNYRACTTALSGFNGRGILEIL